MTRALVGLLAFLGVSALGGGAAMLLAPDGSIIGMDPAVLTGVPLMDDWFLPGLFLAVVLGAGSLVTAWAIVGRPDLHWAAGLERATGQHVAWLASLLIGILLVTFIIYEAQIITAPDGRWLQWLMGATGATITALTTRRPVRRDLHHAP